MSKITVARVYKVTDGSALVTNMTSGSPANGGTIVVEAITDFDPVADGETRTVVIDSEQITYTDIDEDTDSLLNITRAANGTTAAAHTPGVFVQAGVTPKVEKFADGWIDDDDALAQGVEILRHLWRFYPTGDRDNDEMELATVRYLDDDHPVIVDAPDQDKAVDGPPFLQWSKTGRIYVSTRPHRLAVPYGGSLEEVFMTLGEGGEADDAVIVDILKDGVSILTEKITIPAGEWLSNAVEPTTKALTKFDPLQIQFEQVGSDAEPGEDPTLIGLFFAGEGATAGRIEVVGPQGPAGAAGADGADGADGVISEVQNEGSALADQSIMNFTGAGVDVTVAGGKYVVDIAGAAGSVIGAKAYRAATYTHGTGALNSVKYDTALEDPDGFFDATNWRFVIPSGMGGRFDILAHITQPFNSSNRAAMRINVNGSFIVRGGLQGWTDASGLPSGYQLVMQNIALADSDTVSVQAWLTGSSSLNGGSNETFFSIHRVGD